jgi:hypothetical protein
MGGIEQAAEHCAIATLWCARTWCQTDLNACAYASREVRGLCVAGAKLDEPRDKNEKLREKTRTSNNSSKNNHITISKTEGLQNFYRAHAYYLGQEPVAGQRPAEEGI